MGRYDIKMATKEILESMEIFYKIYTEPTDIEKERSFPIAWIYLGPESVDDGDISYTNYMRNIDMEITVGSKHSSIGDKDTDMLIDKVFETLKSNFTLNGTAINLTPVSVLTDQGYFHPYALASISYTIQMR